MSTPPNKREERLAARRAHIASAQQSRAPRPTADSERGTGPSGPEIAGAPAITPLDSIPEIVHLDAAAAEMSAEPADSFPKGMSTTGGIRAKTPSRPVVAKLDLVGQSAKPGTNATPRVKKTPTAPLSDLAAASTPRATPSTVTPKTAHTPDQRSGFNAVAAAKAAVSDASEETQTKRDQRRELRLAAQARVQTARRQALLKKKRQDQFRRTAAIAIGIIAVLLLSFLIYKLAQPATPATLPHKSGFAADIPCDTTTHDGETHYHANLQIVINGQKLTAPPNVGILSTPCLYWTHTHDTTGIIHIEAPGGVRTFVLGDFLAVWQEAPGDGFKAGTPQPITNAQFLGLPRDADHPLKVYVNGQIYTGDPNLVPLKSKTTIWLVYGKQDVTPTNFDFPANGYDA